MIMTATTLKPIGSGALFEMGYLLTGQSLVDGRRFGTPLLHPPTQPLAFLPALHTGAAGFSVAAGGPGQCGLTPNDH